MIFRHVFSTTGNLREINEHFPRVNIITCCDDAQNALIHP